MENINKTENLPIELSAALTRLSDNNDMFDLETWLQKNTPSTYELGQKDKKKIDSIVQSSIRRILTNQKEYGLKLLGLLKDAKVLNPGSFKDSVQSFVREFMTDSMANELKISNYKKDAYQIKEFLDNLSTDINEKLGWEVDLLSGLKLEQEMPRDLSLALADFKENNNRNRLDQFINEYHKKPLECPYKLESSDVQCVNYLVKHYLNMYINNEKRHLNYALDGWDYLRQAGLLTKNHLEKLLKSEIDSRIKPDLGELTEDYKKNLISQINGKTGWILEI